MKVSWIRLRPQARSNQDLDFTHSHRTRLPTWKVREAESWNEILRRAKGRSCGKRKRRTKKQKTRGLFYCSGVLDTGSLTLTQGSQNVVHLMTLI